MQEICRLCCSDKFVNNYIFDEENALYLKMSLYLPIKVFKGDRLPQKVCDRCSCKVNDFYQFCNETIEVQSRLRSVMLEQPGPESIDLTLLDVKPRLPAHFERATQTDAAPPPPTPPPVAPAVAPAMVKIKEEPLPPPSPIKDEEDGDNYEPPAVPSDSSEDVSLINLKRKKKKRGSLTNGVMKEHKKRRRKPKEEQWQQLVNAALTVVERGADLVVKTEEGGEGEVKSEPGDDLHTCCMCFVRCYSRAEMLHHYKEHARQANTSEVQPPPPPPAPPDVSPLRCPRCHKLLEDGPGVWAAHWARHWERDTRRPYRCALCDKTFSTHLQILKHGATHADAHSGGAEQTLEKRFVCDLCPEAFVYMRCLSAHRDAQHPEARGRAPLLRCVQCGRGFAHLNSLRRHWRAHSGARDHLCAVCGKALSSREHLKFHLRIHSGYKPNVCKTCGKGFVKKCNLTLHERVHSGEKPHVCSHCGKAFSQRSTLVIHERYHSGARPYVCALCGRGFVAKGLLSMHLKTTCV